MKEKEGVTTKRLIVIPKTDEEKFNKALNLLSSINMTEDIIEKIKKNLICKKNAIGFLHKNKTMFKIHFTKRTP